MITYPASRVLDYLKRVNPFYYRAVKRFVEFNDNTVFITKDELYTIVGVEVGHGVAANVVARFNINVVK